MDDQLPLVLRLFARFIPGDLREPIAGDLHEEYHAIRHERGCHVPRRGSGGSRCGWRPRSDGSALRAAGRFRQSGTSCRGWAGCGTGFVRTSPSGRGCCDASPASPRSRSSRSRSGLAPAPPSSASLTPRRGRLLPYARADCVMSLAEQRPREGELVGPVAPADYFDWQRENRSFSAMAAYQLTPATSAYNLTGTGRAGTGPSTRSDARVPQRAGRVAGARPRFSPRRGSGRPPPRRAVERRAVAASLRRRPVGARSNDRVQRPSVRDRRRAAAPVLVADAPGRRRPTRP